MAFTKVVGPGIHTLSNIASHNINSSGIITATQFDGPFSNVVVGGATTLTVDGINISAGILTAQTLDLNGNGDISGNLVVGGNLTANGDFTTLNTTLREVELLRVDASSGLAAGIITQRGAGDILRLYDDSTQVVTVLDTGEVGINVSNPSERLHVYHATENLVAKFESGDAGAGIIFKDNTHSTTLQSNNGDFEINVDNGGDLGSGESLVFKISGTEKLSIASNGTATATGTSDGVLQLDTSDSRGAFIRFGQGGSYHHMVGCADGLVAGPDKEDLALRAKDNMVFCTNGANEVVRIDSDGRLLIGRSSAYAHADADNLIVGNNATNEHQGITILSHTGKYGGIYFGDGDGATGSNRGKIIYDHPNDQLGIGVGGSTATQLRITSAGNLGLSNTGTNSPNNYSGWCTLTINGTSGAELDFERGGTLQADILCGQNGLLYTNRISGDYHAFATHNGTSGAERLRITSAGNLKLPDDAKIELGGAQTGSGDLQIYHTTSGTSWIRHTNSSEYLLIEGNQMDFRDYATGVYRARMGAAVQLYYNGNNVKLATTNTGITVTGEVAASQDYPNLRPTLDLNFAAEKKLDPRITYQRTGPASFVNEFGKVVLVSDNAPRFDHNSDTRECKGLLIEESRTNNNQNSVYQNQFQGWTKSNFDHQEYSSETAPDGSSNVTLVSTNNANTTHYAYISHSGAAFTGARTVSAWFKKLGTTTYNPQLRIFGVGNGISYANFVLTGDGTVNSGGSDTTAATITPYPNDWYRCTLSWNDSTSHYGGGIVISNNTSAELPTYTGDADITKGFLVYGFQDEAGSFPTSYIPTNGSTATRGADTTVIDGEEFTEFFDHSGIDTNDYQGTLISFMELDSSTTPSAGRYNKIQLELNNDNKISFAQMGGGTPYIHGIISYGGSIQIDGGSSGSTFPTVLKQGLAFAKNNAAFCYNGNTVHTDNSVNVGHPNFKYTQLSIGGSPSKAHIKRITYYSNRISNTQLRNLTS